MESGHRRRFIQTVAAGATIPLVPAAARAHVRCAVIRLDELDDRKLLTIMLHHVLYRKRNTHRLPKKGKASQLPGAKCLFHKLGALELPAELPKVLDEVQARLDREFTRLDNEPGRDMGRNAAVSPALLGFMFQEIAAGARDFRDNTERNDWGMEPMCPDNRDFDHDSSGTLYP